MQTEIDNIYSFWAHRRNKCQIITETLSACKLTVMFSANITLSD